MSLVWGRVGLGMADIEGIVCAERGGMRDPPASTSYMVESGLGRGNPQQKKVYGKCPTVRMNGRWKAIENSGRLGIGRRRWRAYMEPARR